MTTGCPYCFANVSEAALKGAWNGDVVLLVPELALAEAAQVLLKKERAKQLSVHEADVILAEILALPLEVVGHADLISPAASLARRLDLTVNDAIFLARSRGLNGERAFVLSG